MKKLILIFVLLLPLFGCKGHLNEVSIEDFQAILVADSTAQLLDVRPKEDFLAGHLQGAVNLPWEDCHFKAKLNDLLDSNRTVLVYCRTGKHSQFVVNDLDKEGYVVYKMAGGFTAWAEAGMPAVTE